MSEELSNDNISVHSIDFISQSFNKNLRLITDEKDKENNIKNNFKDNENKTSSNLNKINNPLSFIEQPKRANSCEKRKKNKILEKKMKEIMEYREKFKSLEMKEKLEEEEIKKEEDGKKKKVETKVNRNLKLLNMIKEKMKLEQDIKDKHKDKNENKDERNNNKKNDDISNKEDKKENIIESNNKNENKDEKNTSKIEEDKKNDEKRNKLLKLLDKKASKEINNNEKENKNENKTIEKEEEDNEIKKENNKDIINKYQKIKVPHSNVGAVSFKTFMKKGSGNFHINTPKSKIQNKKKFTISNSNEKESESNIIIQKDNYEKDNKFTDIPIEQKNKLTIRIKSNNTPDNLNNSSNLKEYYSENKFISTSNNKEEKPKEKDINNSNTSNNKKNGAMKILELLKAKKKEQNENKKLNKSEDDEDKEQLPDSKSIQENNQNNLSNAKKEDEKKIIKSERHNEEKMYDQKVLPKKKFMKEYEEDNFEKNEDEEQNQILFKKNNKQLKQNYNYNDENDFNINNNSSRIKANYFNNINNNINNYFNLGENQNYPERQTIEYLNNANLLRNKYHKKIKGFYSTNRFLSNENDEDDDEIFRISNNSHINYFSKKNPIMENNNFNTKNLDKSYDILTKKKSVINKNILSKNIESKNIINNNSPRKKILYHPYEKNTAINLERKGRIYNKFNYQRKGATYIKKSPGRIINSINKKETDRNQNRININYNNLRQIKNKYNKNNINKINNKNYNVDNIENMEISTIYGLNSSIDSSISSKTNNKQNKLMENQKENTMLFNLKDLLILEERINNITLALESNKNVESQCFNFWNYYFDCSFYKILEKIFPNKEESNIIRLSTNYELMSIMVCYDFSFGNNVDDEDLNLSLIELIYFNHNNLIIICEYILNKITIENTDNIYVLKLKEIVKNSTLSQSKEFKMFSPIQKISNNTNKIIKKIKSILLNYQSDSSSLLKNYILYLPQKSYSEINSFFRTQILRINNNEGSLVPPSYFQRTEEFIPMPAPYLQYPSLKPYTLILDLDETLVSFQLKSKKEGTLRARPFLFAFLEEMGHYYELIVWTSATESYAHSLVEAIEYDKQYFDYILYREHSIIIGDEFVKDLTRVGRGLDRIIIVDDMPQNFRLQKQNGITIKPFYGDDYNDTALYDLLPILKHIAEEGNDVRIELAKYRNEIVKKISTNISFNNI